MALEGSFCPNDISAQNSICGEDVVTGIHDRVVASVAPVSIWPQLAVSAPQAILALVAVFTSVAGLVVFSLLLGAGIRFHCIAHPNHAHVSIKEHGDGLGVVAMVEHPGGITAGTEARVLVAFVVLQPVVLEHSGLEIRKPALADGG